MTSGHATDRTLRSLAWDVDDLPRLCEECRAIVVELKVVKERVEGPLDEYLSSNVPRKLVALRGRLFSIERGVPLLSHCCYSCICHHDKYRRASHQAIWPSCPLHTILQFHGWPVQRVTDGVVAEMHKRGMKVVGTCTCIHGYVVLRYCTCTLYM